MVRGVQTMSPRIEQDHDVASSSAGADGVAAARASSRRAVTTCRFSTMRPFTTATPSPRASAPRRPRPASRPARSRPATARRPRPRPRRRREDLVATASWSGWISVLPSNPMSRPCTQAARSPSLILEGVVDAIDADQPLGPRGEQAEPEARDQRHPVRRMRGAEVLDEIVGPEHEALEPRMRRRDRPARSASPRGVSIIAQIRVRAGRALAVQQLGRGHDVRGRLDLGQQDRVRSGRRRPGQVGLSPTRCRAR